MYLSIRSAQCTRTLSHKSSRRLLYTAPACALAALLLDALDDAYAGARGYGGYYPSSPHCFIDGCPTTARAADRIFEASPAPRPYAYRCSAARRLAAAGSMVRCDATSGPNSGRCWPRSFSSLPIARTRGISPLLLFEDEFFTFLGQLDANYSDRIH